MTCVLGLLVLLAVAGAMAGLPSYWLWREKRLRARPWESPVQRRLDEIVERALERDSWKGQVRTELEQKYRRMSEECRAALSRAATRCPRCSAELSTWDATKAQQNAAAQMQGIHGLLGQRGIGQYPGYYKW